MPNKELTNAIQQRYKNIVFNMYPPVPQKRMKIEVSDACNQNCIFCGRSKAVSKNGGGGVINRSLFLRILHEAYELGVREIGLFNNGEPFTAKHLADYIKNAKDIGYEYVYITTNGALATPERLREVIDAGLDSIKFSINAGTGEMYKFIHGRDDFDTVLKNLKYCFEYRKTDNKNYKIYSSCVVTKHIANELPLIEKLVSPYVDELTFYNVRSEKSLLPDTNISEGKNTATKKCIFPFNTINIGSKGQLFACCNDVRYSLSLADLNKMSLKDAWHCENMINFRKKHLENNLEGTPCKECIENGDAGIIDIVEINK